MKIELTCAENATFATTVEIHGLDFDSKANTFSMRVIMGDDWIGQKVHCPVDLVPISVHVEEGLGRIHFQRYKDAAAFGAWLIESDTKVEHGYRTMGG